MLTWLCRTLLVQLVALNLGFALLSPEPLSAARRGILSLPWTASLSTVAVKEPVAPDVRSATFPSVVTVPLFATGSDYVVFYRVDGSLFRAALDTGSPFLLIPGTCWEWTRLKSGCFQNQGLPSGLSPTVERFDGFEGLVEWRRGTFELVNATVDAHSSTNPLDANFTTPLITFGVASESIMKGPGGIFFGLIRDTAGWIRPSLLSQTPYQAFGIDLINRRLTLSSRRLLEQSSEDEEIDFIPLNKDLRRLYGDPVDHYTVIAEYCRINQNQTIGSKQGFDRAYQEPKFYVILDTGVTGMIISQRLWDERYQQARANRDKKLWGQVTLGFRTAQGNIVEASAVEPLTTAFAPEDAWKRFPRDRDHLIVMGLAFLEQRKLTIDIGRGARLD